MPGRCRGSSARGVEYAKRTCGALASFARLDYRGLHQFGYEGFGQPTRGICAADPPSISVGVVTRGLRGTQHGLAASAGCRGAKKSLVHSHTFPAMSCKPGVARYKGADDAGALKATAAALREKYPSSPWATKASVWG